MARIAVEDEGDGVASADRARVFERFRGDGTGLGLAIVRATAERHGGAAGVEGARFWIEVPLRKASESNGHRATQELEKGTP
jgi:signal transduction histidine kinase